MNVPNPIRLFIVDDQQLLRESFVKLLELEGTGLQVLGTAGDGAAAISAIAALAEHGQLPDVVLMDIRMPRMDGVAATAHLTATYPTLKIIMLTTFDDEAYVVEGLKAGARGYLLKDISVQQLIAAIHAAHQGETTLQSAAASTLVQALRRTPDVLATPPALSPEEPGAEELTEREREILKLLAQGASNREISEMLFITEGTVKNHVSNILSKLGLRDRTQAALFAHQHGLA